nr:hypothetical protein [Tanacetum cinerariifolium]
MIGSLMYLTASRPNIQFSICLHARYQANPKESHLVAVKRIFRYLKGTPNLGLHLKAYSDSDYAGCNLDRKSTSGAYQILGGKLVPIFCDNTSAINNPVLHSRTKHIDIRYHFIKDHILRGDIEFHFVPTDLQLADIFTKPLAEPSFTRLVAELGYLKEFWYTVEVDEATKNITFLLSSFKKPLSFTQEEFISTTGLPVCENVVPTPFKETTPLASKVSLTSHMLKVAKLFQEPEQSLIISSEKVNGDDDTDKSLSGTTVQPITQPKAPTNLKLNNNKIPPFPKQKSSYKDRVILPKKQVTAKEPVAIADATKSLEAFESTEEQVNHPKTAEAEKEDQEEIDITPKDTEEGNDSESLFGLRSMPDDDLASMTGFETQDSADHFFEEDALKDTLPQLTKDAIKSSISESVAEELPHVVAQVQKNLQDQLPNFILKPMYKEFNAFNKLESQRFVLLQKEQSKSIHNKGEQPSVQSCTKCMTSFPCHKEKALVLHTSEESSLKKDTSGKKETDDEPSTKKLKFLISSSSIPSQTPLKSIMPEPPKVIDAIKMTLDQFIEHLSKTTSSIFSPTLPREPTPPKDFSKGKEVAITDEQVNKLVSYQEEGGFNPKMPKIKFFATSVGPLSQEEFNAQIKEMKRLANLKVKKEKSKQEL